MHTVTIEQSENISIHYIQDIIDSHDSESGLMIHLKRGHFLSSPLTLRSHMTLFLEEGSRLSIIDDFSLFPPVFTRWEGTECHALHPLVFAEDCCNILIDGKGEIDGNGNKWWQHYRLMRASCVSDEVSSVIKRLNPLNSGIRGGSGGGGRETGFLRPPLLQLKECRNVRIKGVTLSNSPFWNTHILYSHDISFKNVTFKNPLDAPNSDGLDIDSSENITVDSCLFSVGDDCLCIKSGMDDDGIRVGRPSRNIKVKNCTMEKGHGALVIGSETSGGISDVSIDNCLFSGTDRGIRIKSRRGRGGIVENIALTGIMMDKVAAPIVINMFYRCGADTDKNPELSTDKIQPISEKTPVIRQIRLEDIRASGVTSSSAFFSGLPESPISCLTLKNIHIDYDEGAYPSEPAMDFFHTMAEGPHILCSHLEHYHFEGVTIQHHCEPLVKDLNTGEPLCLISE